MGVSYDTFTMPVCRKCEVEKEQRAFENYKRPNGARGWRRVCHGCRARQTDPVKRAVTRKRAYEKMGSERWNEVVRVYRAKRKAEGRPIRRSQILERLRLTGKAKRQQREEVFAAKGRICDYCGRTADTIDHVIPLSRGGTHDLSNIVPACKSCNSRKKNKLVAEWRSGRDG